MYFAFISIALIYRYREELAWQTTTFYTHAKEWLGYGTHINDNIFQISKVMLCPTSSNRSESFENMLEWLEENKKNLVFASRDRIVPEDAILQIDYTYNGMDYNVTYDSGKPVIFPPYKEKHVVESYAEEYDSIKIKHRDGTEKELTEDEVEVVRFLSGPLGNFYSDVDPTISDSLLPAKKRLIEKLFTRETDTLVMENTITDERFEF